MRVLSQVHRRPRRAAQPAAGACSAEEAAASVAMRERKSSERSMVGRRGARARGDVRGASRGGGHRAGGAVSPPRHARVLGVVRGSDDVSLAPRGKRPRREVRREKSIRGTGGAAVRGRGRGDGGGGRRQRVSTTCGRHDDLALFAEAAGSLAAKIARGEDWETATTPLRAFCSAPWWEVSAESGEGGVNAETLRAVASRAVGLPPARRRRRSAPSTKKSPPMDARRISDADVDVDARDAADSRKSGATLAALLGVLDRLGVDGAGRILGAFDLNQWSIKIDHPMRNVCRKLLWRAEYEARTRGGDVGGVTSDRHLRAGETRRRR